MHGGRIICSIEHINTTKINKDHLCAQSIYCCFAWPQTKQLHLFQSCQFKGYYITTYFQSDISVSLYFLYHLKKNPFHYIDSYAMNKDRNACTSYFVDPNYRFDKARKYLLNNIKTFKTFA